MPLVLQAKLLRVIQEREIERLGAARPTKIDIRIIAATNKDLRLAVENGEFREDLFYRLDVLPLKISPLRERKEDILPIAEHFLDLYHNNTHSKACFLSEQAKLALISHDWKGNVRELENTIQRALIMRRGLAIQASELGLNDTQPISDVIIKTENLSKKKISEFLITLEALKQNNGNRQRTADELGISTRALRYKIQQMKDSGMNLDAHLMRAA